MATAAVKGGQCCNCSSPHIQMFQQAASLSIVNSRSCEDFCEQLRQLGRVGLGQERHRNTAWRGSSEQCVAIASARAATARACALVGPHRVKKLVTAIVAQSARSFAPQCTELANIREDKATERAVLNASHLWKVPKSRASRVLKHERGSSFHQSVHDLDERKHNPVSKLQRRLISLGKLGAVIDSPRFMLCSDYTGPVTSH